MLRAPVVAVMVLLLTLPFSGCGRKSGSETSAIISTNAAASLSPEGVVMVNGKELTKADLADEMSLMQMELMEEDAQLHEQLHGGAASLMTKLLKPNTPEYVAREKQLVDRLIRNEIIAQEWEKMGVTAINTEVYYLMEEKIKIFGIEDLLRMSLARINKTLDWYNQQLEDIVVEDKVREAKGKNALAGVDEVETNLNKDEAFMNWYGEIRSQSDVEYADQYRPATPFELTAFLEKEAFNIRYKAWTNCKAQIKEITDQAQWRDLSGLPSETEAHFQNMEKMLADMAARAQNMTPGRKIIADQLLTTMREYTDLYRQDIAAASTGRGKWEEKHLLTRRDTISPYYDQLTQLNVKLLALWGQWCTVEE